MVYEDRSVAGLTLPPKVIGEVRGHLVMKVDEVLWARKPPGEVSAVVMWWGGDEPTTFRPADIAQNAVKRTHSSVIYDVRTSLDLFESYLRKCGSLEIAVADKYGMPIGCASVTNMWQMISKCPYQNYYPIINNFGNRIGDLHVSFNLRMLPGIETESDVNSRTSNKQAAKMKTLKRLNGSKGKQPPLSTRSKEEKTKSNGRLINTKSNHEETRGPAGTHFSSILEKCEEASEKSAAERECASPENLAENRVNKVSSSSSNIISQILEHGTKLRDAMTASVMEDGLEQLHSLKDMSTAFETLHLRSEGTTDSISSMSKATIEKPIHLRKTQIARNVVDYLSGKPMSKEEEEEALAALRNINPTKDFMNDIIVEGSKESEPGKLKRASNEIGSKILPEEILTNITDYSDNQAKDNNFKFSFDVDSQLLSQINCLRITVKSLFLNTVGMKRIGSFSQRKNGSSKSSIALQPPGVTYFVEYDFPITPKPRCWESKVRYCSKRLNGHEVLFGDKTVHNLPATWRNSNADLNCVGSFLSWFSYKVCARHLHQRVPISLGFAALNCAESLLQSTNLRHNYDLPVIGSDNLPVAQLMICLELGRDRIHFGGLFDPENNSLGIRSPSNDSAMRRKGLPTTKPVVATSGKRLGRSVATVTRNVNHKSSSSTHRWKDGISSLQAAQADQVIKQLVADASLRFSNSSESSSAPSTARLKIKDCEVIKKSQMSSLKSVSKHSSLKPQSRTSVIDKIFKHEVALTIVEMSNCKAMIAADQDLYITYKFPLWNSTKDESVQWTSFETEPLMCTNCTWERTQSKIHAVILPGNETFHTFLQNAFKVQRNVKDHGMALCFSVCVKCYDVPSQDLEVAVAYLSLTHLLNLENAFYEAARSNPRFSSSSSCSSITLDLPFHLFTASANKSPNVKSFMKLKVDYRRTVFECSSMERSLPRSRGDSVTGNVLVDDFKEIFEQAEKAGPKLKLRLGGEGTPVQPLGSPLTVPNWARSPDKKLPHFSRTGYFSSLMDPPSKKTHSNSAINAGKSADFKPSSSRTTRNFDASFEPISAGSTNVVFPEERIKCHEYVACLSHGLGSHRSMTNLTQNDDRSCDFKSGSNSVLTSSPSLNSLNLQCDPHLQDNVDAKREQADKTTASFGKAEAATSTSYLDPTKSSKGTDPIDREQVDVVNKSTSTEQNKDLHDMPSQATVATTSEGIQTSPRKSSGSFSRDVGTSPDIGCLASESRSDLPIQSNSSAMVTLECSIDDIEIVNIESEEEIENLKPNQTHINQDKACDYINDKPIVTSASPRESLSKIAVETSKSPKSTFSAKVVVECALHLHPSGFVNNSANEDKACFVFVSFNSCGIDDSIFPIISSNPNEISPAVINDGSPEWQWQSQVRLPTDLLLSPLKRLVFKVWQTVEVPPANNLHNVGPNNLLGFAALDLTVLAAGLPLVSGWFNIMDFAGVCHGQIKLCVEPLEKISAVETLTTMPSLTHHEKGSTTSLYVAHGAYPDFPSHVTQFTDMRVHKVDAQHVNQDMSRVISGFQLLSSKHQKKNTKTPISSIEKVQNEQEDTIVSAEPPSSCVNTQATPVATATLARTVEPAQYAAKPSSMYSIQKRSNEEIRFDSLIAPQSDPSVVLRDKLSELDKFMEHMKKSMLSQEVSHEESVFPSTANSRLCPCVKDGTCMLRQEKNGTKCKHTITTCPHSEELPVGEKSSSPKQRKMWEKQEDLIDLGVLRNDCKKKEDCSASVEDVAEWLSESAMEQVFSPLLFNDILNSFNSSRGVQVIELDGNENSDDNNDLQDAACSSSHRSESIQSCLLLNEEETECLQSCQGQNRRGDETYRKDVPCFSSNDPRALQHNNRSGLSAGDTDSGVDVDVSANFRAGFFAPCEIQSDSLFMGLTSCRSGVQVANFEKEDSSSSCISSQQQSTGQSSLSASVSATPTDSPQHLCQVHHMQANRTTTTCHERRRVLGKRRSVGVCERRPRRE